MTSTDSDSVSFTYTLVAGAGATDNASFNISGTTLRANDPSAMAALHATASSGLPLILSVLSGNASLTGSILAVNDTSPVSLRASQLGNANYLPASKDLLVTASILPNSHLFNISARARVSPVSSRTLIAGFTINGPGAKRVLLRAAGPSLATLGLQGALTNPRLQVYDTSGKIILENDDWTGAELSAAFAQTGAFPFAAGSRDAAILTTLDPGAYTMLVTGCTETGIALAEVFDASTDVQAGLPRIINLSSRGSVESSDAVLIVGFIITGNSPKTVLVRGIGPALAAYGVADGLPDPRLTVYSGQNVIAQNDDWCTPQVADPTHLPATSAELAAAAQTSGAFSLVIGAKDSAVLVTLAPGAYTAIVSSANTQTGVGMVEVYEVR